MAAKLKDFIPKYPVAKPLLSFLANHRDRFRREMNLQRLRLAFSKVEQNGVLTSKPAFMEFFTALEKAGFGRVIPAKSKANFASFLWSSNNFLDDIREAVGLPPKDDEKKRWLTAHSPAPTPAAPVGWTPYPLSNGESIYLPPAIDEQDVEYLKLIITRLARKPLQRAV